MKILLLLICLVQLLRAEEPASIRAYYLERLSSLRSAENSGIRPGIFKPLKSAPFPSRFFREGDDLIGIPKDLIGFRDKASRAVYNRATSRLVVLATPRDHWGIAEVLREKQIRQHRVTVRILELAEVPSVILDLDQRKVGKGAKGIKLLELSGGGIIHGETLDGQLQVQVELYGLDPEAVEFSIVSKIPNAFFSFKSASSILIDQPLVAGIFCDGEKGGFAVELLVERIQLNGTSISEWILEEETGQGPVNPFEKLGDERFKFEEQLPDGRVRRSLGLLPDYDRFLPRRERIEPVNDPFAADFREKEERKLLPLAPDFYAEKHPFLKGLGKLGLIDATQILADCGVKLGPHDFAVIEPSKWMFVVETESENFEVIEKKVMEESYGTETAVFVDFLQVSSDRRIDVDSLEKEGVRTLYQTKILVEDFDDFEGEYSFEGNRVTFLVWRHDQGEGIEITLDHKSDPPGKNVNLPKNGWMIVRQIKREGKWLTWVSRQTLENSNRREGDEN